LCKKTCSELEKNNGYSSDITKLFMHFNKKSNQNK
jgi:hypothetical protein